MTDRTVPDPRTPEAAPPGPSLDVPQFSLVVLVGVSGSGKSTFARTHVAETEVLSDDVVRSDTHDEAELDALLRAAAPRLVDGGLTVVDATNVQPASRTKFTALARAHDVPAVAVVLDVDPPICQQRNASRPERTPSQRVVRQQADQLRRDLPALAGEGFERVHVLTGPDEIAAATIVRTRLDNDLRHEQGPFDVIGDVHGCRAELVQLLDALGYRVRVDDTGRAVDASHPAGRRVVFVGDLVDRGPDVPGVLRLVMGMGASGHAFCVAGNHDDKLARALLGRTVAVTHGLAESLEQLAGESEEFRADVLTFLDGLASHYVLDDGRLVVAHAGIIEAYQGRASRRVRAFCLYGETTGEKDEFGLPVRHPWARQYRGRAMVLYGHTPTPEPEWVNNTLCLDTGCVFGGALTALRYPERELVSVPAAEEYYRPSRPLRPTEPSRGTTTLSAADGLDLTGPDAGTSARRAPAG